MYFKSTQIQFSTIWTKRIALTLSLLYLANPLQPSFNFVFHQLLSVFESPNQVIGHTTNFNDETSILNNSHKHKTMSLESGHSIVDFVAQLLKKSNEEDSSDKSLQKIIKIDKHIAKRKFTIASILNSTHLKAFWVPEQMTIKGYLTQLEAPPQLSS